MNNPWPIAIVAFVCAVFGSGLAHLLRSSLLKMIEGEQYGIPYVLVLGAVTGLLVGIPLGRFFVSHRRRWLVAAVLCLEVVASGLVGGWLALGFTATAAALTFCVSAFILRDLYDSSEWGALGHHFRLAFDMVRGIQIIDEGKTIVPPGKEKQLGPHLTIVRAGNAVVRKNGARITGVSGPAIFTSAPFEYIAHIYDLRERQAKLVVNNALTRDMVPVTIEMKATFTLNIARPARMGEEPLPPDVQTLLSSLPYRMPDWEAGTISEIERAVRQVVCHDRLTDLVSATHYPNLGRRILHLTNTTTRDWGVIIETLIVNAVQPKPDLTAATERRWMADTDAETTITREQGEAEAMRNTLQTIAEGYEAAKASGMTPNQIQREVLHHILEQFARDPLAKVQLTPELNDLIRSLVR